MELMYKYLIFAFILFLFTLPIWSAVLYVDNSSAECNQSTDSTYDPITESCGDGNFKVYSTIQKAANVVNSGDTVIVKDGIYTDENKAQAVVRITRGGSSGSWVTFKSENKHGAILDGSDMKTPFGFWGGKNIGYVSIEDFEIRELKDHGIMFGNNWSANNWKILGNNIQKD